MKDSTKNEIIKLFWVFIIASVIGCIVETTLCFIQKGYFEVRQGLIYGPFIPVYGAGAILFYIIVPKITKATTENTKEIKKSKIFFYTMILGGVTEYLFSYAQECLFGTVSWEYGALLFNLNGRTSLLHCIYWGIYGVIFIKLIYPQTKRLDNFSNISKGAKVATFSFIIFMVINIIISMLAGYRQYERMKNIPADTRLEKFLDKYYPDSIMDIIFSNKQYTSQVERIRRKNSLLETILSK